MLESEAGDILHVGRAFKGGVKCTSEYLDTLEVVGIKNVRIRGVSHMPDFYEKSRVYTGCLRMAIEDAGYNVTMRLNEATPDAVYFATTARYFIVGVGGYSRFMGNMVEGNGGKVYGRRF